MKLFKSIGLRLRIFVILSALVLTVLAGGALTMVLVYRISSLLTTIVDRDVQALNVAQQLETALVMQKGLLTYYFLDGDPDWLKQLEQHRDDFEVLLGRARESSYSPAQREILNRIESGYIRYSYSRDRVISLYRAGDRKSGFKLHSQIRTEFFAIRDLCQAYNKLHESNIVEARKEMTSQIHFIHVLALTATPGALILGFLLGYILLDQVLGPIRQLAMEADPVSGEESNGDEVKTLSRRVHDLIKDVDQTHSQLEWSQEHLVQSEKLAQVGKLAAGVAHSIRNPLTSVKMRLFSLERSQTLSINQKEDFEVIAEEIRHIDTIVRNFLEFSRPPKLKMQLVSPSDVVDMALQLLKHRLDSYGVEIELRRERRLPEIRGDAEQLKEVLVNLLVNACEVMNDGGTITIEERVQVRDGTGRAVAIRVSDTGPGIPQEVLDKVFQPFFSTKEEGTGLGLSISTRIVEEHGGRLRAESREGAGATFAIVLPMAMGPVGQGSDLGKGR